MEIKHCPCCRHLMIKNMFGLWICPVCGFAESTTQW